MRTLVLYIMLPDTTIIPCVKCLLKQGQVGSHEQLVGMGILFGQPDLLSNGTVGELFSFFFFSYDMGKLSGCYPIIYGHFRALSTCMLFIEKELGYG